MLMTVLKYGDLLLVCFSFFPTLTPPASSPGLATNLAKFILRCSQTFHFLQLIGSVPLHFNSALSLAHSIEINILFQ